MTVSYPGFLYLMIKLDSMIRNGGKRGKTHGGGREREREREIEREREGLWKTCLAFKSKLEQRIFLNLIKWSLVTMLYGVEYDTSRSNVNMYHSTWTA